MPIQTQCSPGHRSTRCLYKHSAHPVTVQIGAYTNTVLYLVTGQSSARCLYKHSAHQVTGHLGAYTNTVLTRSQVTVQRSPRCLYKHSVHQVTVQSSARCLYKHSVVPGLCATGQTACQGVLSGAVNCYHYIHVPPQPLCLLCVASFIG